MDIRAGFDGFAVAGQGEETRRIAMAHAVPPQIAPRLLTDNPLTAGRGKIAP